MSFTPLTLPSCILLRPSGIPKRPSGRTSTRFGYRNPPSERCVRKELNTYLDQPLLKQLRQLTVQALREGLDTGLADVGVDVRDVPVLVLALQVRGHGRRRGDDERPARGDELQRGVPHAPVGRAAEDDLERRVAADELRDLDGGIGGPVDDVRRAQRLQVRGVVWGGCGDYGREAGEFGELDGWRGESMGRGG